MRYTMKRRTMLKRLGAGSTTLIAVAGNGEAAPQCECTDGCCQDCPDHCVEAGCIYC